VAKSYRQHCSVAHALDLVGERWTLLIVRELVAGPRRYGDLASGLVTVPSNLLAARLKQMEEQGLIRRRALAPPAQAVVVYELTELGASLGESLAALARWGMQTIPAERGDRHFRSHWLVVALRARFQPRAADGLTEAYEFRIEGDDTVNFVITDGEGVAGVGPVADPAVVIEADADTFLALTEGRITPAQAIARGARMEGRAEAFERLGSILPVKVEAPA
jgi:DNA-binding HxlR family transcriptional regulator